MNNVAKAQAIYEAFGRGDIPYIVDQLADDVRWEDGAADHGIPWLVPGVGKQHVLTFFECIADFDFKRFDVQTVCGEGDTVVAVVQVDVLVKSTGGSFSGLEVHVWHFGSDGKAASFNHVVDTITHLAAIK